jgi:multidrug efflux pump subunit AcrB
VNLSTPFIHRPVATALLMTAVAFMGISAFPFLPVASLPQVDFPTIQVQATLPGASAETMASAVAAPLERQFSQISGITQLTSQSTLGATEVVIQFDLNRSLDSAAQDVQAAIITAGKSLPQAMSQPPIYRKINPADAPILTLSLRSETLPLTIVQENADNFLIPAISQVSGVGRVSLGGDRKPSIRIQVDPAKLGASGLTLEEVRSSIVGTTTNAAKGTINTASNSFTISANDQISEAQPFEDVVLAYRNGAPIRIRDVGQAVAEASNRNVAAYQNNDPGILINVHKQPGANVIETVELIKAQLPRLTAKMPPAITVDIILDRTRTIRASVHEVEFTLVLTVCLVILVILLFLRNAWATIIPASPSPWRCSARSR